MKTFVRWAVLRVVCLAVTGCFVPVTYEKFTCVICRRFRLTMSYAALPVTKERDNECSLWHAAHVEPSHAHLWERSTCVYETDLLGLSRSVGCRPGHYPIWLLPPSTQMAFYQNFKDPLEAKALFVNLTDAKTHNDRLDENDEDKGHLMVRAIGEWQTAGFPGTWGEWWGRWYAKHVEERKDYAKWLRDDSGLNFGDWLKQRGKPNELVISPFDELSWRRWSAGAGAFDQKKKRRPSSCRRKNERPKPYARRLRLLKAKVEGSLPLPSRWPLPRYESRPALGIPIAKSRLRPASRRSSPLAKKFHP